MGSPNANVMQAAALAAVRAIQSPGGAGSGAGGAPPAAVTAAMGAAVVDGEQLSYPTYRTWKEVAASPNLVRPCGGGDAHVCSPTQQQEAGPGLGDWTLT